MKHSRAQAISVAPLQPGQTFAGYEVLRVLGVGGMGTVYLATHPRLPREDALKVLPADCTDDTEYRARFTREADLAAALSHPHIVGIQDRGEYDGQLWISMDYVPGTDAARLLDEYPSGRVVLSEVVSIVAAVGSALDHAHRRGLLHRDVKPANILLADPDGQGRRVYLADFGIARRIDDSAGLTETNMAVGTVAYAAPEQLKGDPVDGRADQYALACTAFHLLTSAPPFPDSNPTVVITQHVYAAPPSIGALRPELHRLDPVFAKAMAKKPSDRYGSCGEFAAALSGAASAFTAPAPALTAPAWPLPTSATTAPTPPPPKRTAALIAALLAVAALIGGGIFAGITLSQQRSAPSTPATTAAAAPTTTVASRTTAAPSPGPLLGTYRADFGAATDLDGNGNGPGPVTGSYALRSVCRATGCVATASNLSGGGFAPALVFDDVGGRWLAVALTSEQCRGVPSEYWQVFTLQLGPDGVLTGEFSATTANTCRYKRSVTFSRTGDLGVDTVADPAALPPRVASPADALRGRYHVQRTFADGHPDQPGESSVGTACLRAGERCISYFHSRAGDTPLIFANGMWTLNIESDYQCPAGGTTHFSVTAKFPLPQPLQDPLPLLSGTGHQEQTGACAVNTDFTETFTRTGD